MKILRGKSGVGRTCLAVTLMALIVSLIVSGCGLSSQTRQDASADAFVTGETEYAWLQMGKGNQAIARMVIPSADAYCPTITLGKVNKAMVKRAIPEGYEGFAGKLTLCEFAPIVPTGDKISINYENRKIDLPSFRGASDEIVVMGDTGCRVTNWEQQTCSGDAFAKGAWGFPKLAATVAEHAASDLILHVGDYYYREYIHEEGGDKCQVQNLKKGWEYCGDNWPTWESDFFAAAKPLLPTAPWVFVRGNHETCSRGWQGYFLFFSPDAAPATCQEVVDPYLIELNTLDIYMADTSNKDAEGALTSFKTINAMLKRDPMQKPTWLATHVPMEGLGDSFQASELNGQPQLKWIHVGHVHNFQHIPASKEKQTETVTGGSGTALDACSGSALMCPSGTASTCCYGATLTDQGRYSYMTVKFHSTVAQWTAVLRDIEGNGVRTYYVK